VNIFQKLSLIKSKLRQDNRNRNALLTGFTATIARFIFISTSLISIPITAHYLGKEQFGIWLLISTFANWISIADLGLTNSLVNILSFSLASSDREASKKAVSSAFFPMLTFGFLLLLLCFILSFYSHLDEYLNIQVSTSSQIDTHWSVAVVICFFAIKIPLSIPRCIFTAYQQGYIYQLWTGLTNFLSLPSLLILQHYNANLPCLLAGFFACMVLGDILAGVDIFYFRQPWLKPKLRLCDSSMFHSLFKVGAQFWIIQICAICIYQTDLIIVSQLFGIAEVSVYGLLIRMFSLIEGVCASFLSPLWPAYTNAQSNEDYQWIKKTFRNSVIGAFIWAVSAGGTLVTFSPILVNSFLGENTSFSIHLPIYMLITSVLLSVSQCIAVFVNGLGEIKTMFVIGPLAAITNILLSVTLGKVMGLHGITFATAICIFIFSIVIVGGNAMKKYSKILF
jgi:O-antigen/teichoic acid export membrane protein